MSENLSEVKEYNFEFNRELFDRNFLVMISIIDRLPEKFDLNTLTKFYADLILMEGSLQQILISILSQDSNPDFNRGLKNFENDTYYNINLPESFPQGIDVRVTHLKDLVGLLKKELIKLQETSKIEYKVRNDVAKLNGLLKIVTKSVFDFIKNVNLD